MSEARAMSQVNFDKRIRNILSKNRILSESDLERAIQTAGEEAKSLATVLVTSGFISERTLIGHIAREMKIPPIDLEKVELDQEALETLPQNLASDYGVLPVSRIGNTLTIAVSNPFDIIRLDDVRLITGCELRPVISTEENIRRHIESGYNANEKEMAEIFEGVLEPELEIKQEDIADEDINLEELSADGSPIVKLVNLIIYKAVKDHASDIHIEPFENRVRVRYRQDGVMFEAYMLPKRVQNSIVSRVKILSNMDIAEKRKPQDGKFQIKVEGRQIDFRVSVLPVVHGEKVVLRILDVGNLALSLDRLGLEPEALEGFRHAIAQPYGMILVTGPTGSGKSTTLYSAVKEILSVESNFVTVEDPVEYQIEGVNQVQVQPKRGVTFASALRSILRQDPDVILIGEIRDAETIEIAVKAALTGHLVLSTLHTNDAPSTVTRMVDMGVDPFLVASSVLLIAAQRLCRKLCDACKAPLDVPKDRLIELGLRPHEADAATLFKAVGCSKCNQGFRGRFALMETMVMTELMKDRVLKGASGHELRRAALDEQKMLSLRHVGLLHASRGRTSVDEVLRVSLQD